MRVEEADLWSILTVRGRQESTASGILLAMCFSCPSLIYALCMHFPLASVHLSRSCSCSCATLSNVSHSPPLYALAMILCRYPPVPVVDFRTRVFSVKLWAFALLRCCRTYAMLLSSESVDGRKERSVKEMERMTRQGEEGTRGLKGENKGWWRDAGRRGAKGRGGLRGEQRRRGGVLDYIPFSDFPSPGVACPAFLVLPR